MRSRLALLVVAVALATGCSAVSSANVGRTTSSTVPAPAPAAVTTTTTFPAVPEVDVAPLATDAPEVFVVGDSLTEGTEPWLAAAMRARGWRLTGVDARVGRPVTEGLAVLKKRAATLPSTVIVALGTNNLGASAADIDTWVRTARRLVGDRRRLVWVNLSLGDDNPSRVRRYREINDALDVAAERWRVDVLDWDGFAHRHHLETKADGIHYEDAVYRIRALFYASALRRVTS